MMEILNSPSLSIKDLKKFKPKPNESNLGFGKIFTDRMLVMRWKNGLWQNAEITRYRELNLFPATVVFHYGQAIFEGMKAFRQPDGSVKLFRPEQNAARFNHSARRMVMPEVDETFFTESIKKLVELEQSWVPNKIGSSLYIRPTMIAAEPVLGVKPANEYLFFVILSPSASYFPQGFDPTKIKVETRYVRAVEGGIGGAKASANYAGSLLATQKAKKEGYNQVLWLDAVERKYVEEVGSMNIAFVINDKIYSPKPRGTILDGITRKSVKQLTNHLGIEFLEDRISIDMVINSIEDRSLSEIFGIGTAAVIAPVGILGFRGIDYFINNNEAGPIAESLFKSLTDIQYGISEDIFGWMY